MAYSKVILNGTTLMDVTADTVAAATLLSGETATKKDGTRVTGTLTQKTETTLTATDNDTYTPPTGSVYSSVTVNVPQTTVTSLSVTENGTYTAPSGTAYSPVTVDVAGSSVATVHITTASTSGVGYYTGSDFTIKSPQPNPATGFVVYDDDMVVGTLLWDTLTVSNSHLQLVTGSSRGGYLYKVIA